MSEILALKLVLAQEIADKKLDLATGQRIIEVVNMGSSHEVIKQFFGKSIVFIPSMLLLAFFAFSFLAHLDRKAKEYRLE